MSIGAGIALFVIGAILAFATDFKVAGIDFDLIGYILMIAGVVGFLIGLGFAIRGRSAKTIATSTDPASGQQVSTSRSTKTTGDEIL